MNNRLRRTLFWLLACMTIAGCQSFKGEKNWFGKKEEVEYAAPNKIVAIWTDAVHNQSGFAPTRGLGGRLYFYDAHHKPVQVNGSLTVFVYDDTNPEDRESQASTRKVRFTPEQVAALYTPSEFGPSYSVWVPWDEVGGEQRHLSLIPVFTDHRGQMLAGDQAQHVLPGAIAAETAVAKRTPVSTADYVAQSSSGIATASAAAELHQQSVKSTTIKLPATMQKRIRNQPTGTVQRRSSHLERATSWTRTQLTDPGITPQSPDDGEAKEAAIPTTNPPPQSAHSALRPLRAQASQSAQPDRAPAPTPPDHVARPSGPLE